MTVVINLFGPPCSGKSTIASGLFYLMKMNRMHCDLVHEYIKAWNWEDRTPNEFDQTYIFGKQVKYESRLYGKADYVVTDSPIALVGFYEEFYLKESIVGTASITFMKKAESTGVKYINFWLPYNPEYDERGRYQDSKESYDISVRMPKYLSDRDISCIDLSDVPFEERALFILNFIKGIKNGAA